MPARTVFISSTYRDLKEHRQAVWEKLEGFNVTVRGMEQFGARTATPLETCLAEVEQCDVYVGIIAYRLGSIDPVTKKPFTLLEYEKAIDQKKEILTYIADDDAALFPRALVDQDAQTVKRLEAFKGILRERHTIVTFSTPEDLAAKLATDLAKHFSAKRPEEDHVTTEANVYLQTARVLKGFRLTPRRFNGREIRMDVCFHSGAFAASRALCRAFNLDYGLTIGCQMSVQRPTDRAITAGFGEMYATGNRIDTFQELIAAQSVELYARLQFTAEDVRQVRAEFFGDTYLDLGTEEPDDNPNVLYVPPEGKVILLFTKPA